MRVVVLLEGYRIFLATRTILRWTLSFFVSLMGTSSELELVSSQVVGENFRFGGEILLPPHCSRQSDDGDLGLNGAFNPSIFGDAMISVCGLKESTKIKKIC